jgi:hypothetical protein
VVAPSYADPFQIEDITEQSDGQMLRNSFLDLGNSIIPPRLSVQQALKLFKTLTEAGWRPPEISN